MRSFVVVRAPSAVLRLSPCARIILSGAGDDGWRRKGCFASQHRFVGVLTVDGNAPCAIDA